MSTLTVHDALALAVQHHQNGRLVEAGGIYRQVLQVQPDNPDALHLLGLVERAQGRGDVGQSLIRQAIGFRPDFPDAFLNLGNGCRDLGQLEEAADAYDRARELRTRRALLTRLQELTEAPRRPEGAGKLILGLAMGYSPAQLEPFVESLAASGYDGDATLFVAENAGPTIDFLRRRGVRAEVVGAHQHMACHIALSRYLLYYDYLTRIACDPDQAGRYGRILLVDTRDVAFQDDPFPPALEHDVTFVLESREFNIGQDHTNTLWLREAFGDAVAAELAGQPISCSGTTFATFRGALQYLLYMQILALGVSRAARYRVGIDQGIHNFMLHKGPPFDYGVMENARHVVTLGRGHQDIVIDADGSFYGADGALLKIVHQYDYHAHYAEAVRRRLEQRRRPEGGAAWTE